VGSPGEGERVGEGLGVEKPGAGERVGVGVDREEVVNVGGVTENEFPKCQGGVGVKPRERETWGVTVSL